MASPKDKANKKIKLILEKILEEYELGISASGDIKLETRHFLRETGIDNNQFISILRTLKSKAIIEKCKVHRNAYEDNFPGNPNLVCVIRIDSYFKALAQEYIEFLSESEAFEKTTSGSIIYLTDSGDLWHGVKEHFCYPMKQAKQRLEIIRYLVRNKGYQKTKSLAMAFDKEEQHIRTTINKIEAQIKKHLDIGDLVENRPGSGYRINPKYEIRETK